MKIFDTLNFKSLQDYCEERSFLHLTRPHSKVIILMISCTTILCNSNIIIGLLFSFIIIIIIFLSNYQIDNFIKHFYGIFFLVY